MNLKRLLGILVLMVLAVVVVFVLWPVEEEDVFYNVYRSARTISEGEPFSQSMVEIVQVRDIMDWMVTDLSELDGLVATRPIASKRFLDANDFSKETPILYKDGEGEYTIRVKPEYVNGGKIEEGDIVDVIYVERTNNPQSEDAPVLESGVVVVRDVPVISLRTALGEDVEQVKNSSNNSIAAVTLKVHIKDAERLSWYQEYGFLSLFVKKGE